MPLSTMMAVFPVSGRSLPSNTLLTAVHFPMSFLCSLRTDGLFGSSLGMAAFPVFAFFSTHSTLPRPASPFVVVNAVGRTSDPSPLG